jgi:CRP-like cAMP-binding protein
MNCLIKRLQEEQPLINNWPLLARADTCPDDVQVQIKSFGAGEIIFYGGDANRWVNWLLEGSVQAGMSSMVSVQHSFIVLTTGQSFGEYEAVSGLKSYLADIVARTDVIVVRIPTDDYMKWLLHDNVLMLERYGENVRSLLAQSFNSNLIRYMPSIKRLALFITRYFELHHSAKEVNDPTAYVRINMLQDEICQEIGVNIRSVGRSLNELADKGLILRKRGKIYINRNQVYQIRDIYFGDN